VTRGQKELYKTSQSVNHVNMSPRERILEAAMTVFVRYGFRLTSMERVGKEAGLSRQAVYNHFETKEALFRAVVELISVGSRDAAEAAAREAEAAGASLSQALTAQLVARLRFFTGHMDGSPHAEELLAEHSRQTQDLKEADTAAFVGQLVATMARYAERGTRLRPDTAPADLARLLILAEYGAKNDPRGAAALPDFATLVDLIVRGATVPPGPGT